MLSPSFSCIRRRDSRTPSTSAVNVATGTIILAIEHLLTNECTLATWLTGTSTTTNWCGSTTIDRGTGAPGDMWHTCSTPSSLRDALFPSSILLNATHIVLYSASGVLFTYGFTKRLLKDSCNSVYTAELEFGVVTTYSHSGQLDSRDHFNSWCLKTRSLCKTNAGLQWKPSPMIFLVESTASLSRCRRCVPHTLSLFRRLACLEICGTLTSDNCLCQLFLFTWEHLNALQVMQFVF